MYFYVFSIIFLISIISSHFKKEHYTTKSLEEDTVLKTNIFDNILEKVKNKTDTDIYPQKPKRFIWKQLRNNIDDHTLTMFRLKSDKKYKERISLNNLINAVKQKYNNNLCKRYVKYYNFDSKVARMTSPRTAELKPLIDVNTGVYSESLKQCVHPNPEYINKFKCPESIICPNNSTSSKAIHKLKDYEYVCEYTCV